MDARGTLRSLDTKKDLVLRQKSQLLVTVATAGPSQFHFVTSISEDSGPRRSSLLGNSALDPIVLSALNKQQETD